MEHWVFGLRPKGARDIHGITLREGIREIALGLGVNGEVRNNKGDGTVQVTCQVRDEGQAREFFESIQKMTDPLVKGCVDEASKMTRLSFEPPGHAPSFKGFEIKREDELSEMVWALQGAGRVFGLQEEKRKHVLTQSLERALKYGLTAITDCATELQSNRGSSRQFILLALDNYLKECPREEEDFVAGLYDLRQLCDKANGLVAGQRDESTHAELGSLLQKIVEVADDGTKKLEKNMNK